MSPITGPRVLCLTASELSTFLDDVFPGQARGRFGAVAQFDSDHVRFELVTGPDALRRGRIVAGPVLMGLADVARYAVVVAHAGPVAMTVTGTLSITFLRACAPGRVTADAWLVNLGRRAASVDVRLWQHFGIEPVAQALIGYVIPR